MADYYQLKNQNIFNPPANTSLGNATNQFDDVYVQNELVLGNTAVTGATINTPKVSTITYPGDDTAADPAGGQTITLTGSGFLVGATVLINNIEVSVVSVVNSTTITFTSPANSTGSYVLYVINTDGGTAIAIPGIQYSGTPTWTTAAGSLGSVYETASFNSTVTATGDAPITYSVASGTLPPGATFNSNGTITGTSELLASPTTYTFTVRATDAELQDTNRTFSLTINPDVVTWVSPANGTTYTTTANSAISNVTLSATSAVGSGITYTANALPTGISLTGDTISGTPTVEANSSSLLTATANTTSESANITINWTVSVANDIYFEYNTLLIPGASTTFVDDASTNNFAVTINGDTKPNSFNPYTPGYYSNYFAANEQITSASIGTTIGTGDFSLECWVNVPTASNGYAAAIQLNVSTGYNIYIQTHLNTLRVLDYNNPNGSNFELIGGTINNNTWYHLVLTRQSGTIRGFINGKLTVNQAGVTFNYGTAAACLINSGLYASNISNARVVLGNVPTEYQTSSTTNGTQIFTSPATPLTAVSGTAILTSQSNRFIDNSTNALSLTLTGAPKVQSFIPFTPNTSYSSYGSGYFDGTGDYLSLTGSGLGSGSFTIEMWVYMTSYPNGQNAIYSNGTGDNTNASTAVVYINSSGTLAIYNYPNSITTSGTVSLNQWNHVAIVRNSGTISLYINGVSSGSGANTNNISDTAIQVMRGYGGITSSPIGYVSNVRVVVGTAVYTTTFTPPSSPLTAIANTQLLTLQNNQSVNNNVFLDNSTNNFLVTRAGNTTQGTFSPYGGNWSNYFGGQMVSTLSPSSTNFNLTGDFTLEAYVFLTALPGGDWGILDARVSGATAAAWLYSITGGGKINFYEGSARIGATTVTLNTWHHVAWVRNGSALRGYLDGVLDYYNGSYGTGAISPGSTAPVIGTKDYGISSAWGTTGYISNLRVVNGTAVYTTSSTTVGTTIFTPSTTPLTPIANTVLLSCADSRFMDDSVNNYTITPSSSTISAQRFSPFNPSSVTPTSYSGYFGSANGNSIYLSAQVSGTGGVALSGDYTIEMWLYPTAASGSGYSMLVATNTNGGVIQLYYNSSGALGYYSPVAGQLTTSSAPLTFNAWQHVAFVRSSNVVKVYVNGVEKAFSSTITDSSTVYANYIGGLGTVYNTFGYISNLRVNNTAIYTSGFTPPTSPLTAISGTQLLTLQSSTIIDNSTNNYTISTVGSPQPSIQNPFGYTSATTEGYSVSTIGGSGYFDGTTDYLQILNTTSVVMGTGAFTAEAWVYPLVTDTWQGGISSVGIGGTGFSFNISNTNKVRFSIGNGGAGTDLDSTANILKNTWSHIAITRNSSGTMSVFINGVLQGTASSSADISNTDCVIGRGYTNIEGNYLNGYISDARVIKGQVLYTSNFVPPTQPLTAVQNTSLLTNMTGAGIYDASMMNDMETIADTKLSTAVSKFGGSSMYFDGTGDYLKFPSNQIYSFGTGDFTIEGWLYFTGNQNFGSIFISSTTGAGNSLHIQINNANKVRVTNETTQFLLATNAISLSTWTHIAVVRSGTTLSIYQNGTLNGSTTNSTDFIQNGALVGLEPTGGSFYYDGYIDDLRVTKGYARYTSNFTPPTSAFPTY